MIYQSYYQWNLSHILADRSFVRLGGPISEIRPNFGLKKGQKLEFILKPYLDTSCLSDVIN